MLQVTFRKVYVIHSAYKIISRMILGILKYNSCTFQAIQSVIVILDYEEQQLCHYITV